MNILFYLIPKKDVYYLLDTFTIRQALEKMEYHHYSCIPILDKDGNYVSSISDGDLLWYIKGHNLDIKSIEHTLVKDIPISRPLAPIKIDANMNELTFLIANQNFVPVVDDRNKFIGIITRQVVLRELYKKAKIE
ncbi:MAG: CBS domain-containing protein [Bacilli bacterium]